MLSNECLWGTRTGIAPSRKGEPKDPKTKTAKKEIIQQEESTTTTSTPCSSSSSSHPREKDTELWHVLLKRHILRRSEWNDGGR